MPWDRAGPCPGDHPGDLWLPSLQRDRWSPLSRLGYSHALGARWVSVLEVLAANRVEVMIGVHDSVTPTPVISHAILTYKRRRTTGLVVGIVITVAQPTGLRRIQIRPALWRSGRHISHRLDTGRSKCAS